MKIGFSGLVCGDGSVCGTSFRGWRLLGGRVNAVWTSIPSVRLTHAGKGITICRTRKREGRIAVSVTDLRRSNRLRQGGAVQTLVERGCGLDVHQATVVACLLIVLKNGQVQKQVRTFGTTTRELMGLREWLLSGGCTHVAMESTGVY